MCLWATASELVARENILLARGIHWSRLEDAKIVFDYQMMLRVNGFFWKLVAARSCWLPKQTS
jgi:hypothetical protein